MDNKPSIDCKQKVATRRQLLECDDNPNGAPANPITVHRALLKCGVDATAKQVCTAYFRSVVTHVISIQM